MARVNGQDLSISPPFSPYDFLSRCDFSTLLTLRQIDYWFNFTYSRSHAFHYGCQSKRNRPFKNRTNEPALLSMRVYPLQHTPLGRRLLNLALVRLLTGLFFCSDFGSGKSGVVPDFRAGLHVFLLTAIRHWVSQLDTDGVHSRKSAGTGLDVFKAVPVTGASFASPWTNQCAPLFSSTNYWWQ